MLYETFLYIVEFGLLTFDEGFCISIHKGYYLKVIFNLRFKDRGIEKTYYLRS